MENNPFFISISMWQMTTGNTRLKCETSTHEHTAVLVVLLNYLPDQMASYFKRGGS
jgi:hypothetical protein